MVKEYKAKELSHLLSLANDMREAKGDDKLEMLPLSFRGLPDKCIIANAFNYNCVVYPGVTSEGRIYFRSLQDAENYCKIVDIDPENIIKTHVLPPNLYQTGYQVPLTNELNTIARRFDSGQYLSDGF